MFTNTQYFQVMLGVVSEDIVIGAGGLEFNARAGQIRHSVVATAAMFLRICVAKAQR